MIIIKEPPDAAERLCARRKDQRKVMQTKRARADAPWAWLANA